MKYENPTCEIVVLEQVDCITTSVEIKQDLDSPLMDYNNY